MRRLLLLLPMLLLGCLGPAQEQNDSDTTENLTDAAIPVNDTGCACEDGYAPVCGKDKRTYQNECQARCAGTSVDYQGICKVEGADIQPDKCKDADGGKDEFIQANVTAFGKIFEDSCEGASHVKEYYCVGDEAASLRIRCPEDFRCINGSCVRGMQRCFEDDGGYDIYVAGSVNITGLIKALYIDKCTSDTRLREYYCEDDELKVKDLECPTLCKQARCVR